MSRSALYVVLLILALIVGATPVAMGVYAKHALEAWVQSERDAGTRVTLADFEQRYAVSTARTRWVIETGGGEDLTLVFSHELHHVPNIRLELFWIHTILESAPGNDDVLRHYFQGATAFSSITSATFDKRIETTFTVPSVRAPHHEDSSMVVEWHGVSGRLALDPGTPNYTLEHNLALAGVHVEGQGTVQISNMHASIVLPRGSGASMAQSVRVEASQVAIRGDQLSLLADGVEVTGTYRRRANHVNGSVRFGAKAMTGQQGDHAVTMEDPRYAFEIKNVSEETLSALLEMPADPSARNSGDPGQLETLLGGLARAGTRIKISIHAAFEGAGTISGEAGLGFVEAESGGADGYASLLSAVRGSLEVVASRQLLETYFSRLARDDASDFVYCKGMGTSDAEVSMIISSMTRAAIKIQTEAGLLIDGGDEFRTVVVLENGNLMLNDQPLMAVLLSLPLDVPPHFAPGSGFNRIAKFAFSNARGTLKVILEGTACAEFVNEGIQVTIVEGRARLNPKVDSAKGADLFSVRAALGKWTGDAGNSRWTTGQSSRPVELRRVLAGPEEEIRLDGLRFEIPLQGAVDLSERWIIFVGHDGNEGFWFSQGQRNVLAGDPIW